ncbi:alanine racemase [Candidatus Neomarinimicrobiota bacterium]
MPIHINKIIHKFKSMSISQLKTPTLLLDIDVLKSNISNMAERVARLGPALRPHIKTHKCIEVAKLQEQSGAQGFCVSTLAEAEVFIAAGFTDLTYAVPLEPGKIERVIKLARDSELTITIDDLPTTEKLQSQLSVADLKLGVWIKVDCGYHRAGVDPKTKYARDLARFIDRSTNMMLLGLLTHAGHAYKGANRVEIMEIGRQERNAVLDFRQTLERDGLVGLKTSIGSTPTISVIDDLDGIDEVRPGNYVFFDRTQLLLGSCSAADCALTVRSKVISRQPESRRIVIDAGALALSHDPGPLQLDSSTNRGMLMKTHQPLSLDENLYVNSVSQEHGIINVPAHTELEDYQVGAEIHILPNHSCLTAALFDNYYVVRQGAVIDKWKIERLRN